MCSSPHIQRYAVPPAFHLPARLPSMTRSKQSPQADDRRVGLPLEYERGSHFLRVPCVAIRIRTWLPFPTCSLHVCFPFVFLSIVPCVLTGLSPATTPVDLCGLAQRLPGPELNGAREAGFSFCLPDGSHGPVSFFLFLWPPFSLACTHRAPLAHTLVIDRDARYIEHIF